MPMMVGFAEQRRRMLEAEFVRFVEELPPLGVERLYATGDFGAHLVGADTPLEVVIVHQTDQPWRRRADFFVDHLRPQVETRFHVYTPGEFAELSEVDPVIVGAREIGEPAYVSE
jgi:hypothetical protein